MKPSIALLWLLGVPAVVGIVFWFSVRSVRSSRTAEQQQNRMTTGSSAAARNENLLRTMYDEMRDLRHRAGAAKRAAGIAAGYVAILEENGVPENDAEYILAMRLADVAHEEELLAKQLVEEKSVRIAGLAEVVDVYGDGTQVLRTEADRLADALLLRHDLLGDPGPGKSNRNHSLIMSNDKHDEDPELDQTSLLRSMSEKAQQLLGQFGVVIDEQLESLSDELLDRLTPADRELVKPLRNEPSRTPSQIRPLLGVPVENEPERSEEDEDRQ